MDTLGWSTCGLIGTCNEVDNLSETIQFRDFLRAWSVERGSVGAWEREERGSVKSVKA